MRDNAAGVLAQLGEPLGNAFVKTLQGDRAAMAQLATSKDSRFVELLVKSLDDKEPGVQEFAALALGQIGDARAVASFVRSPRGWRIWSFRSRAGDALAACRT